MLKRRISIRYVLCFSQCLVVTRFNERSIPWLLPHDFLQENLFKGTWLSIL